jgi:hypothetical protein
MNHMDQTTVIESSEQRASFTSFLMERSTALSLLIGCLTLAAWLSNRSIADAAQAPRPSAEPAAAANVVASAPAVPFNGAADAQAFEKDRQAQVEWAKQREQARLKLEEATSKMKESREAYQFMLQEEWTSIIYTNTLTFNSLRSAAAHSDGNYVPCQICNTRGKLNFCVLCQNSGKCPGCHGTGVVSQNHTCPTCLGSGHCFLCAGTGKMTCPFCDDGEISAHQHNPSTVLPVF